MHAAAEKTVETGSVEEKPVSHQPPRKTAPVELETHLLDVVAHQGFAAGESDKSLVGVDVWLYVVNGFEKEGCRHVGNFGELLAVAAAMAAVHVAAKGAFPKYVAKFVDLAEVVA